jgi:two-component system LytT family response regulator
MRAVIIDDEGLARTDLRTLLGAHPEVTVVGEAALLSDARALLRAGAYDLVFLDIQLLGGTGFDLVPEVRPGARIIFVTAHDQFALRAFEANALDYLLKPVRVARLAEALERHRTPRPPAPPPTLRPDDVVYVKTGPGAARFVRVADILVINSDDNYSEAILTDGERLFVRQTLACWEQQLPATHFMRVHRRHIVNLANVQGYTHENDELTHLRVAALRDPVRARRQHWAELRRRLTALGRPL